MTLPFKDDAAALHDPMPGMFTQQEALPAGYLEYQCRLAIRDLIALHAEAMERDVMKEAA